MKLTNRGHVAVLIDPNFPEGVEKRIPEVAKVDGGTTCASDGSPGGTGPLAVARAETQRAEDALDGERQRRRFPRSPGDGGEVHRFLVLRRVAGWNAETSGVSSTGWAVVESRPATGWRAVVDRSVGLPLDEGGWWTQALAPRQIAPRLWVLCLEAVQVERKSWTTRWESHRQHTEGVSAHGSCLRPPFPRHHVAQVTKLEWRRYGQGVQPGEEQRLSTEDIVQQDLDLDPGDFWHPPDLTLRHKDSSSWSQHSSSPASTTATRSWLDSLPPPSSLCSASAARLVFNLPKFSHVTPLFRDLHWLPVAARIRFKTMVPTYKAVNGTAPTHLQALVRPHAPARALRVTTSARRPWNDLPADVRTAQSITCFHKRLKTHLDPA
ncbi:hypothetical protein N1851_033161 [Merluccius polli]|uniref:Uncharacterized protein n=1 Tax=Merluccius polli TaxID=89951 RepID=A0AA47M1R9_MERPO|nr:hypothetical protein N1851_033161 [Merluccius polli]